MLLSCIRYLDINSVIQKSSVSYIEYVTEKRRITRIPAKYVYVPARPQSAAGLQHKYNI